MENKEFIKESVETCGDINDSSKDYYVVNGTKVKINCPVLGLFKSIPYKYLKGDEVSKCMPSKPYHCPKIYREI
jgi:hypothetical protein